MHVFKQAVMHVFKQSCFYACVLYNDNVPQASLLDFRMIIISWSQMWMLIQRRKNSKSVS